MRGDGSEASLLVIVGVNLWVSICVTVNLIK